jgi:hypothetical protein
MAHMQIARGIGQHFKLVKFRLIAADPGFESAGIGPFLLPLGFDLFCEILFVHLQSGKRFAAPAT